MTDNSQPTEQTPPAAGATETGAGPKPGTPAQPTSATFTQEDVNRMVRDRVKETKDSAITDLLKKLGVSSEDDLKTATTKYKEFTDAQLTAQQKLERDLATASSTLTSVQDKYRTLAVENAALKAFGNQVAPDRYAAAIKLLDTSKLSIGDDGKVSGMDEAVKALLEENPFLKPSETAPTTPDGKKKTPPIDATNPAGNQAGPDLSWHPLNRQKEVRIGGAGITTNKE
jgi:hypothetical protein